MHSKLFFKKIFALKSLHRLASELTEDSRQEEEARRKRSEVMRNERTAEAQQLISQGRSSEAKAVFERHSSAGQMNFRRQSSSTSSSGQQKKVEVVQPEPEIEQKRQPEPEKEMASPTKENESNGTAQVRVTYVSKPTAFMVATRKPSIIFINEKKGIS